MQKVVNCNHNPNRPSHDVYVIVYTIMYTRMGLQLVLVFTCVYHVQSVRESLRYQIGLGQLCKSFYTFWILVSINQKRIGFGQIGASVNRF